MPKSPIRRETKYREIAHQLLREIREGMAVGDKLPPEVQLAERFGVHVMTVREALRVLQDGGVILRQRAVGTQVINPMGGSWVSIICEMNVFSPSSQCLFHRSVIYHLRHFLKEAGLLSRVSIGEFEPGAPADNHLTSMDFIADIEANRLSGVLALSVTPSPHWLQRLEKQEVPVVGSNDQFPNFVTFSPFDDLSRAVRSLLDYGRKRIAYMGWLSPQPKAELPHPLQELIACYPGILRKEWIKCDIHPELPKAGRSEFLAIWNAMKDKPDGLIVDDEHLLPDVENALAEQGIRVPEDLLIVAHRTRGNDQQPDFPVIHLESDPRLYAYRMAEMFLKLYRGERLPDTVSIVQRLLVDDALRDHPSAPDPVWARIPPAGSS